MAFWKKSDDPWDQKPTKKQPTPAPEPSARVQAKPMPKSMDCPWCGKAMFAGNLYSSVRGGVYQGLEWREGEHKNFLGRLGKAEQERCLQLGYYEEAWYCEDCRRLVMDVGLALKQQRPNYEWKDGKIVFPEEETEE